MGRGAFDPEAQLAFGGRSDRRLGETLNHNLKFGGQSVKIDGIYSISAMKLQLIRYWRDFGSKSQHLGVLISPCCGYCIKIPFEFIFLSPLR
jgi:hypothetical protein